MLLAENPPAIENCPTACKILLKTVFWPFIAVVDPSTIPVPRADQALPFHLAILAPGDVKKPEAYRDPAHGVIDMTFPVIPELKVDQLFEVLSFTTNFNFPSVLSKKS